MDNKDQQPKKTGQTNGQEIERTHESYEKGYPAPGTRDAGEEGKDFVAHNDHGESGQTNTQTTDPAQQNRQD